MGVDLAVLRVRFTPADGQVYGPPDSDRGTRFTAAARQALIAATLGGRLHDIVPPGKSHPQS